MWYIFIFDHTHFLNVTKQKGFLISTPTTKARIRFLEYGQLNVDLFLFFFFPQRLVGHMCRYVPKESFFLLFTLLSEAIMFDVILDIKCEHFFNKNLNLCLSFCGRLILFVRPDLGP